MIRIIIATIVTLALSLGLVGAAPAYDWTGTISGKNASCYVDNGRPPLPSLKTTSTFIVKYSLDGARTGAHFYCETVGSSYQCYKHITLTYRGDWDSDRSATVAYSTGKSRVCYDLQKAINLVNKTGEKSLVDKFFTLFK